MNDEPEDEGLSNNNASTAPEQSDTQEDENGRGSEFHNPKNDDEGEAALRGEHGNGAEASPGGSDGRVFDHEPVDSSSLVSEEVLQNAVGQSGDSTTKETHADDTEQICQSTVVSDNHGENSVEDKAVAESSPGQTPEQVPCNGAHVMQEGNGIDKTETEETGVPSGEEVDNNELKPPSDTLESMRQLQTSDSLADDGTNGGESSLNTLDEGGLSDPHNQIETSEVNGGIIESAGVEQQSSAGLGLVVPGGVKDNADSNQAVEGGSEELMQTSDMQSAPPADLGEEDPADLRAEPADGIPEQGCISDESHSDEGTESRSQAEESTPAEAAACAAGAQAVRVPVPDISSTPSGMI